MSVGTEWGLLMSVDTEWGPLMSVDNVAGDTVASRPVPLLPCVDNWWHHPGRQQEEV